MLNLWTPEIFKQRVSMHRFEVTLSTYAWMGIFGVQVKIFLMNKLIHFLNWGRGADFAHPPSLNWSKHNLLNLFTRNLIMGYKIPSWLFAVMAKTNSKWVRVDRNFLYGVENKIFALKTRDKAHYIVILSWPIYCRRVIYKYSTEKALLLIMKMQERVFAPFAYCEQQYFLLNRG